jgi:hypothetical protein
MTRDLPTAEEISVRLSEIAQTTEARARAIGSGVFDTPEEIDGPLSVVSRDLRATMEMLDHLGRPQLKAVQS